MTDATVFRSQISHLKQEKQYENVEVIDFNLGSVAYRNYLHYQCCFHAGLAGGCCDWTVCRRPKITRHRAGW
jgi:hypothetical protein